MRNIKSLNNSWQFLKNAFDSLEACKLTGEIVELPHTWNAQDGQDGGNDYYRGKCWYVKTFTAPERSASEKVYLEFLGVAMSAEVWLNDRLICSHQGGYSTFRTEITEYLKDENVLVVSVDNSDSNEIYPQKADFTFYGGIYRSVNMIIVPQTHFDLDYNGAKGLKVTPSVDLIQQLAKVTVEAWIKGAAETVRFSIGDMNADVEVREGYATYQFVIENVRLWNGVVDPYLYAASAHLDSGDQVEVKFGCRSFDVDPDKGFILNGKSYPLRGVSRHQDFKAVGNAITLEHQIKDMEIIKEIGATTIRLAHYQHTQEFYDLCDEAGIIVWAEIPYITMHMKKGRNNTLVQMKELVVQCYHHPSIVVWGLSNEITAASVVDEDLLENHRELNQLCHRLDSTRLTTIANVFMLDIDSLLLTIPDINSYNLYFGWYLGELDENDAFFDTYHEKYPDRCIGFSEYGADANPQFQSAEPEKGDYTESYQAVYHEHMLNMIDSRPWLWATHLWNLFDFAADGRDEGGKHGENQKGLVTIDRQIKKDAFYLYKAAWNKKDLFVHICGKRYLDRTESETEIKVYSNCSEVRLVVDGVEVDSKNGDKVFKFVIPIHGEHSIEAYANVDTEHLVKDEAQIRKVAEPNQKYIFRKSLSISNWFDRDSVDPTCFSITDTLGEISEHPEAGAVLGGMMNQDAKSRGDVADVVKDNPALKRMMGRSTLLSMLKQGGVPEENVKQLQRILQTIKK